MRPGGYRHLVTIQRKIESSGTGEYGDDEVIWSTVRTVWARAVPVRGQEIMAASAEQHVGNVRFYIRFIDGIESSMRLVWKGKNYDIIGEPVDIRGEGRELEIAAKVGASEG